MAGQAASRCDLRRPAGIRIRQDLAGSVQEWPKFIEPYLNERPTLALCVALIDVNVPPQQSDRQLLDFLAASGRQVLLVGTKSDRLSNNQLSNTLRNLGQEYPAARLLPYSSKTGAGRDELWRHIREVCQTDASAVPSES